MDSLSDTEASVSLSRCPSSPPGTPSRTSVSPSPSATSRREASTKSFSLGPVPYASTDPAPEPFVASSDEDKTATAAPGYKTPPNTKTADEEKYLAGNTPVKPTVLSTWTHSVEAINARENERRVQYAAEMDSKVVEMPFDEFMSKFMPDRTDMPVGVSDTVPKISSNVLLGGEEPICEELCKVAQAIFDKCDSATEKLVAKDTNRHSDPTDGGDYADRLRADVCFYPADGHAAADYTVENPREPYQGRTCWAWLSLFIEVKTDINGCAFGFTEKAKPKKEAQSETVASASTHEGEIIHVESSQMAASTAVEPAKSVATAAKGKKGAASTSEASNRAPKPTSFLRSGLGPQQSLGQIAEYVSKTLRRQHRLHLFTMFVFHGQARVMRWDRAGAIVSTPIDFEKDPSLLHRVVWNYACMDRVARGHDPTVSLASADEITKMRACKYWSPDNWVEKRRDKALDQPGWPVYKITMRRDSRVNERRLKPIFRDMTVDIPRRADSTCADDFIIGKRHFASGSPTGRGTRCYIAYDVAYDRLVFLKDFWRSYVDEDASPSEGRILTLLRTRSVINVPTPLAHEDVQNPDDGRSLQETLTQTLLNVDQSTKRPLPVQRHYRLVVKEICRPLEDHDSPLQLVSVLYDVVDAHRLAYEANVIHCDMSTGNVLIYTFICRGKIRTIGVLNDWDLAKFLSYLNKVTRPGRSGTWQFMSARLLSTPGKKHELADDLESVIYILRWESLRFYKTKFKTPEGLRDHIIATYERYSIQNGRELGGDAKHTLIRAGYSGFELDYPKNPLSTLLETLAKICQEHYLAVETAPEPSDEPVAPPPQPEDQGRLENRREMRLRVGYAPPVAAPETPSIPPVSAKETSSAPEADLPLSRHDTLLMAFDVALDAPFKEWGVIRKAGDQFATLANSPELQRYAQHTSELSAGSKRSRASDDQAGGRAKRARSGTTSQLAPVAEYNVD